ncbi:hypothetical protein QMK17_16005 [Rhodococcus sp. G-MC3]|uniref:hypothetical protein n=1 Tax=Rhodococcus sp. G-MC3 TaxID=3046209 RepID=UPI0024BB5419|nr:hypothetical protein [Rhodococcus sp. G-MC3]MDJ0394828.1 hypothetical protein [Rhodococcus sp. G-MC3]
MMLALVVIVAVTAALGAGRFGIGSPATTASAHVDGPGTLEELFAARFTRGDIDVIQYRTEVDHIAAQLHT